MNEMIMAWVKSNQNSLLPLTSIHFTNAELVRTVQITPRQKMKKVE